MRYYFAGAEQNPFYKMLIVSPARRFLMSYFYVLSQTPGKTLLMWDQDPTKEILIDSGGYSARVAFKNISLEGYMKFLEFMFSGKFKGTVKRCMVLDGHNLKETLENQKALEDAGYKPIPIYHWSEFASDDREIIQDWIKKYDYIATGGVAAHGLKQKQKKQFYDYVFKHTRDKIKVHGLGMSSIKPCETYPFYSVDSSTWLQFEKFGASRMFPDKKMRKVMAATVHYSHRNQYEIVWYLNFEVYLTRLWARRGIKWDDYDETMKNYHRFDKFGVRFKGWPSYRYNTKDRRFDDKGKILSF